MCEVLSGMFDEPLDPTAPSLGLVEEERALVQNWDLLQEAFKVPKFGLFSVRRPPIY